MAKVYLKDGSEKWILVHTEIEGGNQEDFAFRIFQYHYRLLDRYRVPVETIAVFAGDRNQRTPSEYHQRVIDTSIHFRYRAYHIFDHGEAELLAMDNAFALIVLACQKALKESKIPEEELAEERSTIARALIASGKYDKDRIIAFLGFLKNFIFIQDDEINRIFDTLIYQVTGGTIDMGVIEVLKRQEREQALEKQSQEFITNLVRQTDFDDAKIASLADVSISAVKKVRSDLVRKSK